jgi:DNA-binding NarL/FixJ family response regulator
MNVLIVDDHPIVAKYTMNEVALMRPDYCIVIAGSLEEAERHIRGNVQPDYILLDLMLPDCDGLHALVSLRRLAPRAVVAVVSAETSSNVMRDCFSYGARGYLTKDTGADEFTKALETLFTNGFYYPAQAASHSSQRTAYRLTQREIEVLEALAIGKANKQLAPLLNISESTFKTYLRIIYEKLGARTRVEAVRRGIELGLVRTRRKV